MEGDFKEVLEFYRIINVLQRNGRINMTPSGLQYNGQIIGPDTRTSAEFLATKKDLISVKANVLDEYEELMSISNIDDKTKTKEVKDVKKKEDVDEGDKVNTEE